jgi:hypothetical protein
MHNLWPRSADAKRGHNEEYIRVGASILRAIIRQLSKKMGMAGISLLPLKFISRVAARRVRWCGFLGSRTKSNLRPLPMGGGFYHDH